MFERRQVESPPASNCRHSAPNYTSQRRESLVRSCNDSPKSITRLDLLLLCEQTGFSCIASILLMELHANQNMSQAAHLTDESLAIAAQTYIVEAFGTFNPNHLHEFPVAK
ncbi:hypothetical protein Bca4012_065817 [Brassica carinata]|uniref:Uncharacterized protein n=1 Tax=Brassica carinata TaxID=52824 RepID=A0A8X7VNX4_BRACI|nr:hypothetical protein Bca52824_018136 [Brassica carinata]